MKSMKSAEKLGNDCQATKQIEYILNVFPTYFL